jgi:hypothetical protein
MLSRERWPRLRPYEGSDQMPVVSSTNHSGRRRLDATNTDVDVDEYIVPVATGTRR